MLISTLSEYIHANAPMSNIPELLNLHHSNPLGLHPIAIPIILLVLAVVMRFITYQVYRKKRRGLYPLLYSLWWVSIAAAYYYCFSGDLPLFKDIDLSRTEICVGWFCQSQIVGVACSLLGVVMLSFVTYNLLSVLLHIIAHQSDRLGLSDKEWKEWYWIIIAMLVGASAAGIADDFAPITGVWIMIVYHVVVILMAIAKLIIDTKRTHCFGRCLLSTLAFLITFEAITMLSIECIEGYIYLFLPVVALLASAENHYEKKAEVNN